MRTKPSSSQDTPFQREANIAQILGTIIAIAVPMTQHKYSTKIINAGALLDDTRLLLADWDLQQSVGDNLERVTRENSLAKRSRARLKEELVAFKGRYLGDASVTAALVTLVRAHAPPSLLHPILYVLTIQADPLIGDFVVAQGYRSGV